MEKEEAVREREGEGKRFASGKGKGREVKKGRRQGRGRERISEEARRGKGKGRDRDRTRKGRGGEGAGKGRGGDRAAKGREGKGKYAAANLRSLCSLAAECVALEISAKVTFNTPAKGRGARVQGRMPLAEGHKEQWQGRRGDGKAEGRSGRGGG